MNCGQMVLRIVILPANNDRLAKSPFYAQRLPIKYTQNSAWKERRSNMKKLLIVLAVILTIAAAGIGLLSYANRPLSLAAGNTSIEDYLKKTLDENESLSSLLLTIHSPKTGYHQQFAVGTKSHTDAKPATPASRYHSASIGKTFCATIFGLLKEEGGLTYDDPISTWLDDEILKGLFVVDGADYSNQVTIRHLLSHTSGVGDYS